MHCTWQSLRRYVNNITLTATLSGILPGGLLAQSSLLDTSFNIGAGADGRVYGIVIQNDGKIVVGGDFTHIAGRPRTNLARLHGDGQLDLTFPQGTDGPVNRLLQQPDGKILVGGSFTNLQGVARQCIGRLLANGAVDPDFDAGTNIPPELAYLTFGVQPDGKVLAAQKYSLPNTGYFLKRFDPSGQLDTTFIQTNVFTGGISAICVRTNGSILLGGQFGLTSNNTPAFLALVKTNGEMDMNFISPVSTKNFNYGLQGVFSMIEFSDNSVLICGQFSKSGSTNVSSLAKLTPTLTLDTGFQPDELGPWQSVIGTSVDSAIRQPDGKFILGGRFDITTQSDDGYGDARFRLNIVRIDSQGRVDPCFDPELAVGGFFWSGGVYCLAQQADGKILAGGNFDCYSGSRTESVTSSNLVRFLPQGDCNPTRVHLVRRVDDYHLIGTCAPGGTNHLQVSSNLVDWTDIDASPYDSAPFPYLETWLPFDISTVKGGQFFRVKKEY